MADFNEILQSILSNPSAEPTQKDRLLAHAISSNPALPQDDLSKQMKVTQALLVKAEQLQQEKLAAQDRALQFSTDEYNRTRTRSISEHLGDIGNTLSRAGTTVIGSVLGAADFLAYAEMEKQKALLRNMYPDIPEEAFNMPLPSLLRDTGAAETLQNIDKAVAGALQSDKSKAQAQDIAQSAQQFDTEIKPQLVQEYVNKGYPETIAGLLAEASYVPTAIGKRIENPTAAVEEATVAAGPMLVAGGVGALSRKAFVSSTTQRLGVEKASEYFASKAGKEALEKVSESAGIATVVGLEGGSGAYAIHNVIYNTPDEKLQSTSAEYAKLRETMSEEDARASLAGDAKAIQFLVQGMAAGVISKATGAAKFEGNLFNNTKPSVNSVTRTAMSATKEAVEEGLQGITGQVTQNINERVHVDNNKDITQGLGETFASSVVAGALSGGTLAAVTNSIPSAIIRDTKQIAKDTTKAVKALTDAPAIAEASKPENIERTLDTKHSNYDPVVALKVVTQEEQIPNDPTEASKYSDTIQTHLEQAALVREQIALKLQEEKKQGKAYNKKDVKAFKKLDEEIVAASEVVAKLRAYTSETKEEEINEATTATDTKDLRVFGSIQRNPSAFTVEELNTIKENPNLSTEQQATIDRLVKLKTAVDVNSNVIAGGKGYIGLNQHLDSIGVSISAGNQNAALRKLTALKRFVFTRKEKANALGNIIKLLQDNKDATKEIEEYSTTYRRLDNTPLDTSDLGKLGSLQTIIADEAKQLDTGYQYARTEYNTAFPKDVNPSEQSTSVNNTEETPSEQQVDTEGTNPDVTAVQEAATTTEVVNTQRDPVTDTQEKPTKQQVETTDTAPTQEVPTNAENTKDSKSKASTTDKEEVSTMVDTKDTTPTDVKEDKKGKVSTTNTKENKAPSTTVTKALRQKLIDKASETIGNSVTTDTKVSKSITEGVKQYFKTTRVTNKKVQSNLQEIKQGVTDYLNNTVKTKKRTKPYQHGLDLAATLKLGPAYKLSESLLVGRVNNSAINKLLRVTNKESLLLTEPDIMDKLVNDPEYVKETFNYTDAHTTEVVANFVDDFAQSFNDVAKKTPKEYRKLRDSFQLLYSEVVDSQDVPLVDALPKNVITAMALVGLDYMSTRLGGGINTPDDVRSLLGYPDDHYLRQDLEAKYSLLGKPKHAVIRALGLSIMGSLGISTKTNVSVEVQDSFVMSLGSMALANLVNMRVLDIQLIPLAEVNADRFIPNKNVTTSYKNSSGKRVPIMAKFINISMDINNNIGVTPERIDTLIETGVRFSAVTNKLLSSDNPQYFPSTEAPTITTKKRKRTFMDIPKAIRDIRDKHSARPNKFNEDFLSIMGNVSIDTLGIMFGVIEDTSSVHIDERDTVEAVNKKTKDDLKNFNTFRESITDDTEFYFTHEVYKTFRMGIGNAGINPNSSKVHRELVHLSDQTVTVDKTNTEQMHQFILAISEGLGVSKADKRDPVDVVKDAWTIINSDEVIKAIEAINILRVDESTKAKNILKDTVKSLGGKGESLHALLALHSYFTAEDNTFTTSVMRKVDGITNGVIIGLLLLGANTKNIEILLQKGGVFTDTTNASYASLLENGMNDLYQTLVKVVNKELLKEPLTESSSALLELVGPLVDEKGVVNSTGRDLFKNVLMTVVYGAGLSSMLENLTEKIFSNVIKTLTTAKKNEDILAIQRTQQLLEKVLGKRSKVTLTLDNVLDTSLLTMFGKDVHRELTHAVTNTYESAVDTSIRSMFGRFIQNRRAVNTAMEYSHRIFNAIYTIEYGKKVEELGRKLSVEEDSELINSLISIAPTMKQYHSKTHKDSYLGMDREPVQDYGKQIFKQEYSKPLQQFSITLGNKKPSTSIKSLSNTATKQSFVSIGVAPVIGNIHSADAAMMYEVLDKYAVLNIFDAAGIPLDKVRDVTQELNKAFFEVVSTVDPIKEAENSLQRSYDYLIEYIEANPDYVPELTEVFNELNISAFTTKVATKLSDIRAKQVRHDTAKQAILDKITTITQYNNNEDAYYPLSDTTNPTIQLEDRIVEFLANPKNYVNGLTDTAKESDFYQENQKDIDTFVSRVFGSRYGGAEHIHNFYDERVEFTAEVTPETVYDIYNRFSGDVAEISEEHLAQLDTVLRDIVINVVTPFTYKELGTAYIPQGGLQGSTMYIDRGYTDRNGHSSRGTLDMPLKEIYVHELVHLVTRAGVDAYSRTAKELQKLFAIVDSVVTYKDFIPSEYTPDHPYYDDAVKEAKNNYEYIFRNRIKNADNTNNYLHEFLSYGLTNSKFIEILNSDKVTQALANARKDKSWSTVFTKSVLATLVNIFKKVLADLSETITYSKTFKTTGTRKLNKNNAADRMMMLGQQIAYHQYKHANSTYTGSSLTAVDRTVVNAFKRYIAKPITDTLAKPAFVKNNNAFIRIPSKSILFAFNFNFDAFNKEIRKVGNRMRASKNNILIGLLTEMNTGNKDRKDWEKLINKSKRIVEDLRQHTAMSYAKYLLAAFSDKLTQEEEVALTVGLIRTDLSVLLDSETSMEDIVKYIKDPKVLDSEIQKVTRELQKYKHHKYYTTQATSTAMYLVHEIARDHLSFNAYHIAQLHGTKYIAESEATKIEELVDKLITLNAMSMLDAGTKSTLSSLVDKEFNASEEENGITILLKLHKQFKEESAAKLFEEGRGNIEKGYIHELLDPNIDFIVAPLSEEDRLVSKGYTKRGALTVDPTFSDRTTRHMFVNPFGGKARWSSGATSLTGTKNKGMSIMSYYSQAGHEDAFNLASIEINNLKQANRARVTDIFQGKVRNTPFSVPVPIYNTQGAVVDYRFLMNKETKDKVLKRNLAISQVFGSMQASIDDKLNTVKIDKEVVDLAFREYRSASIKERSSGEYITIGPDSQDKELAEMWSLMPEEMRDYIIKRFGNQGFVIKKHLVDYILGYRKHSPFKKPEAFSDTSEVMRVNRPLLDIFGSTFIKMSGIRFAQASHSAWQELVSRAKSTIVIRFIDTLLGNVGSNFLVLKGYGVSTKYMAADTVKAVTAVKEYQKINNEITKLKIDLKVRKNTKGIQDRIIKLENALVTNPVHELMEAGLYTNIVEDVEMLDDSYTFKNRLEILAEPITSKTPKLIKDVLNIAFMTKSSAIFKFLDDATRLSDFVARYVLHEHNKRLGMPTEESVSVVLEAFVNYNVNTNKFTQYANDMGLAMFTKFFFRIQPVILKAWAKKPATALLTLMGQYLLEDVSDINDSLMLINQGVNFNLNPFEILDPLLGIPLATSLLD